MPFERLQIFFTEHYYIRRSSNLGKTPLLFVQPGTKVNSSYYCDIVLNQGLLPDIQKLSGKGWCASSLFTTSSCIFASSCAKICKTRNWLPKSPDLNPMDYLEPTI